MMRACPRILPGLLLAVLSTTGCLVEGTLDPAGGGQLTLRYRLVSVAHFEQMKARLASPDVTVTEAAMTPEKRATFAVAFRDARLLSTAPAFADAHVTLTEEADGLRTLLVTMTGERLTLPAPYIDYLGREFRMTLTLPGAVVRSNATAVAGRQATWVRPIGEMQQEESLAFRVTYRPAAGPS
jgi:hypothetical protein